MKRAIVVTVSDSVAAGTREDRSGPAVAQVLSDLGFQVNVEVVADEPEELVTILRRYATQDAVQVIATTGGTGIAPRDITPEATRTVIEREIPGLSEWMRLKGAEKTPRAVLSRGICGSCRNTLILNLPGSPAGAVESLNAVRELLCHVVDLLEGRTEHRGGMETLR